MSNIFTVERLNACDQHIHFHSYPEIYGVVKGSAVFTISGSSNRLSEGQMAIVEKYKNHSIRAESGSELLVFPLESSVLLTFSYLQANKKLPRWLMDAVFNKTIFAKITKIEDCASGPRSAQLQLRLTGMLYELLADVIGHYGLESVKQAAEYDMELEAKVLRYIYEHYSEKITLQTLSDVFHISPTVLSRKLRKCLGVDFRVFVNDLRVQKVVQMMNEPDQKNRSIYDVAMSCGFNSMSTFYRCYKRNFGLRTPNEAEQK